VLAFSIAIGLAVCWMIRHALLIIYVSAIFAVVLGPAVEWLHAKSIFGWRPGRGMALLLLILLICVFLGGIFAIAIPSIVDNFPGLAELISRSADSLHRRFRSLPIPKPTDMVKPVASMVPSITSALTDIVTGLLLTAYLILDGPRLRTRAIRFLPPEQRARLQATLDRATVRMRHWLVGQAMLMAILGTSSAITFGLMGLPYFYLLALFAGVANIVPLLGPLATVVVAGAVAATQSTWDILGVIIFYLVYQQVENAFLTPKIMKAQVQISSAMVVIALLIGGELAGIPGVLVAVPSAVLVGELAAEYLMWQTESA
jgi:predicted PurR-regulated permease PerM